MWETMAKSPKMIYVRKRFYKTIYSLWIFSAMSEKQRTLPFNSASKHIDRTPTRAIQTFPNDFTNV